MMIQTCRICAAFRSDPAGFVRRLAARSSHLTHPSVGIGVRQRGFGEYGARARQSSCAPGWGGCYSG